MKDIVMIVAYDRPEFLFLCLQHIATNKDFEDYKYLFVLDYGFKPDIFYVIYSWIERFKVDYEIFQVPAKIIGMGKQSHAVFEGYKKAQSLTKNFVLMIEEDVLVSNKFFQWHLALQKKEDLFCTIATPNQNIKVKPTKTKDYYITNTYQSLGVCFKKEHLNDPLKHAVLEYYLEPLTYTTKHFPDSKININFCEQDGIFNRIVEKNNLRIGFSTTGFAQHSGFFGKNRNVKYLTDTLENKIKALKKIVYSSNSIRNYMKQNGKTNYQDCNPINLTLNWDGDLKKIEI